jgi:hypothetical protein
MEFLTWSSNLVSTEELLWSAPYDTIPRVQSTSLNLSHEVSRFFMQKIKKAFCKLQKYMV